MRPMKTLFFAPRYLIPRTAVLGAILLTVIVPDTLQVTVRAGAVFFRDSLPGDFCLGDVGMAFPARSAIVRADPVRRMS